MPHLKEDKKKGNLKQYLLIPARRSSFGSEKRTPEIDVTFSKKLNSLLNKSRAVGLKPSIIRCLTMGNNVRKLLF